LVVRPFAHSEGLAQVQISRGVARVEANGFLEFVDSCLKLPSLAVREAKGKMVPGKGWISTGNTVKRSDRFFRSSDANECRTETGLNSKVVGFQLGGLLKGTECFLPST